MALTIVSSYEQAWVLLEGNISVRLGHNGGIGGEHGAIRMGLLVDGSPLARMETELPAAYIRGLVDEDDGLVQTPPLAYPPLPAWIEEKAWQ